jgi:ferritin-like metal-binding protein YciE
MEQEARKILKQVLSMNEEELLGLLIEEALEKETARQEIIDEVFRRLNHRTKRLEAAQGLLREARAAIDENEWPDLADRIDDFLRENG